MRKMNGKNLYEKIRKFHPDIRILCLSGSTAYILEEKNIAGQDLKILQTRFHRWSF
jgi:hypothetical protein